MTQPALLAWGGKELRALFPMWLACLVAIALHRRLPGNFLSTLAILAYGFGSIALGAQSLGHEYGYGTLETLLAQPADRRRLFVVKLVVLAVLLAALGFAASLTLSDARPLRMAGPGRVIVLVGLCGLFLAPALTMLARSWIAGAVFTIALPGVVTVGIALAAELRFGPGHGAAIDPFTQALFWPAMFGICAIAAVASWWMFMRLEATDGRGSDIHLPLWLRSRTIDVAIARATRHGAVWQLVAKELHLHQMPFVLAGVYALVIAAASTLRQFSTGVWIEALVPITILYMGGITALIGSFASAEERQLGTLDWQSLMPMAAWKQWAVKVAVAIVLALALGIGIPLAFSAVAPVLRQPSRAWDGMVATVLLLTTFSLYVSSVSTGGVRALLVTLPALMAIVAFTLWLTSHVFLGLCRLRYEPGFLRLFPPWVYMWLVCGMLCGILILLGYRNHRSGERPWQRMLVQIALLAAILAAMSTGAAVVGV